MKITDRDRLIHDLKSPLAAIKGYAFLLQEKADEHPDKFLDEAARGIAAAVKKLNDIIDKNL